MGFNNLKQVLNLIIGSIFCWNISTAVYVNPHLQLPQHEHSKGAPTTVCVEIKPNGVETHNPYYMCNRPQFQTRQLNMPNLVQKNKENYPNYMPQQPINTPSLVNGYQQQQQIPFNGQNYPFYKPQQTDNYYTGINTIGENHHGYQQNAQNMHAQQYPPLTVTPVARPNIHNYPYHALQKPSEISLNSGNHQFAGYQNNHNVLPLIPRKNGVQLNNEYKQQQHLNERNHHQTYSDQSQPFLGAANLVKGNEEHFLNFQSHQQQTTVTKTTNYENHQQQPLNAAGVIKLNKENKQNYTQQQISELHNGHNLQPAQHMSSQTNEPPLMNSLNQNQQQSHKTVLNSSNTETISEKSSLKEALLSHANIKQQEDTKQNVKAPLSREQYQALIQDEVLGVPNLPFSSEEMLPIQQLFRGNLPKNIYNARIPSEHINDPILRNFYNINQKPEVYSQALSQQNCNNCLYNSPTRRMEPYLRQLHQPTYNNVMKYAPNPYMDPNCVDCRQYTMQPILLAIPLFGSQVDGASFPSAQHARALPCGYSDSHVMHVKKDEQPQPKANEYEQPLSSDNSSEISKTTLPTTTTPSTLGITLSSEEDLFKEDSIENIEETKKDNNNKKQTTVADNDDGKRAVDNVQSTTSRPPTTAPVTTFKTIMHAAKMMSKLPMFHHNKRQANYDDGELSTYFKKQYLTELKKRNSEEVK